MDDVNSIMSYFSDLSPYRPNNIKTSAWFTEEGNRYFNEGIADFKNFYDWNGYSVKCIIRTNITDNDILYKDKYQVIIKE